MELLVSFEDVALDGVSRARLFGPAHYYSIEVFYGDPINITARSFNQKKSKGTMVFEEVEEKRLRLTFDDMENLSVTFRCVVEVSGNITVKAELSVPFFQVYDSAELAILLEKTGGPEKMVLHARPVIQHLALPLSLQLRDVELRKAGRPSTGPIWVEIEGKRSYSTISGKWLVTPAIELGDDWEMLDEYQLQVRFLHSNGVEQGICTVEVGDILREYMNGEAGGLQHVRHREVRYENVVGDVSFACQLAGLPRRRAPRNMLEAYCSSMERRDLLLPGALVSNQQFFRRRFKQYATMLEDEELNIGSVDISTQKAVSFWLRNAKKQPRRVRAVRGLVAALTRLVCTIGGPLGDDALAAISIIADDDLHVQEFIAAGGLAWALVDMDAFLDKEDNVTKVVYSALSSGLVDAREQFLFYHGPEVVAAAFERPHALDDPAKLLKLVKLMLTVRNVGEAMPEASNHVEAAMATITETIIHNYNGDILSKKPDKFAELIAAIVDSIPQLVPPVDVTNGQKYAMFLAFVATNCTSFVSSATAEEGFRVLVEINGLDSGLAHYMGAISTFPPRHTAEFSRQLHYLHRYKDSISVGLADLCNHLIRHTQLVEKEDREMAVELFSTFIGKSEDVIVDFCYNLLDDILMRSMSGDATIALILEKVLMKTWHLEHQLIEYFGFLARQEELTREDEDILCQTMDLLLGCFQHPRPGKRWIWVDVQRPASESPAGILLGLLGKDMSDATHCSAAQVFLALITDSMEGEDQELLKRILCCSFGEPLHLLAVYCSSTDRTGHMAALEALRLLCHPNRTLSPREALFSAILATLDCPGPSQLPHALTHALSTFREVVTQPGFFDGLFLLGPTIVKSCRGVYYSISSADDAKLLLSSLVAVLGNNVYNQTVFAEAEGSSLLSDLRYHPLVAEESALCHHALQIRYSLVEFELGFARPDCPQCTQCGGKTTSLIFHCVNCPSFTLCHCCRVRCLHEPHHVFLRIRGVIDVPGLLPRNEPLLYDSTQLRSVILDTNLLLEEEQGEECRKCGAHIVGTLFVCGMCEDYILCADCEGQGLNDHALGHACMECLLVPALRPPPFPSLHCTTRWMVTMTNSHSVRQQEIFVGTDLFEESLTDMEGIYELKPTAWDPSVQKVAHLACYGGQQWTVVCEESDGSSFGEQRILYCLGSQLADLDDHFCQEQGYRVTAVTGQSSFFILVLSKCLVDMFEEQKLLFTNANRVSWLRTLRLDGKQGISHVAATDQGWLFVLASAWIWSEQNQKIRFGTGAGLRDFVSQNPTMRVTAMAEKDGIHLTVLTSVQWRRQRLLLGCEELNGQLLQRHDLIGFTVTSLTSCRTHFLEEEDPEEIVIDIANPAAQENVVENPQCVVCMDHGIEVVFAPCGHFVCCETCAQRVGDRCPVCRMRHRSIVKVYHG